MDGDEWTLDLPGEPSGPIRPADHDVDARLALMDRDGIDLAIVAPSCSIGIECLPPDEAAAVANAFNEGALQLGGRLPAWACAPLVEPDPAALDAVLARGLVGLALPASAIAEREGWERCAPLFDVLVARGRPLFVHPGPAPWRPSRPAAGDEPLWWPALTAYVADMAAAWFGYIAWGRELFPDLGICFAMLAGLAPLQDERFLQRAGHGVPRLPRNVYLETSSYGPRGVDAAIRVLGVDHLLHGSDRPYAEPLDLRLGAAVDTALRHTNPARLLDTEVPA